VRSTCVAQVRACLVPLTGFSIRDRVLRFATFRTPNQGLVQEMRHGRYP